MKNHNNYFIAIQNKLKKYQNYKHFFSDFYTICILPFNKVAWNLFYTNVHILLSNKRCMMLNWYVSTTHCTQIPSKISFINVSDYLVSGLLKFPSLWKYLKCPQVVWGKLHWTSRPWRLTGLDPLKQPATVTVRSGEPSLQQESDLGCRRGWWWNERGLHAILSTCCFGDCILCLT